MAMILARPMPELASLGLAAAGARARAKMLESFPDRVRAAMQRAGRQFRYAAAVADGAIDPRVPALAEAVRRRNIVRMRANGPDERIVHPVALVLGRDGWQVVDARDPAAPIPVAACGTINVSGHTFAVEPADGPQRP